jgi:hypothetical protein
VGYHGRVDLAIGFAWLASERQLRLDLLDGDILEPRDDGTEDREGARHRGRFRLGAHAKSQGLIGVCSNTMNSRKVCARSKPV